MRSEAEIRNQVEARFHRWTLLLINGGAWAAVALGLYLYASKVSVPAGWVDSAAMVMLLWAAIVALHFLRTLYLEGRERFVVKAIEQEREFYSRQSTYEKPKRFSLTDGELTDIESIDDSNTDNLDELPAKRRRDSL